MDWTKRAKAGARSEATQHASILVVDDDLVLGAYQAEILSCAGFEVDIAEDGEAGWRALHAKDYDLLVTDNNMPKVSGLELLKMLRAENADMPVIMVSGAMPTEELKRHPQLNLSAMLVKPFNGDTLLATVERVLHAVQDSTRQTKTVRLLQGKKQSAHALV